MVLSGCRICGNLTNEDIQLKGGTRRPFTARNFATYRFSAAS
jgi:hypothetical protein